MYTSSNSSFVTRN